MRRFIAFIVLAISLLGITLFNVQSTTDKINWSQEFDRGTEVVYRIENREDNAASIDMASVVSTLGKRLEEAGATSYNIDYSVGNDNLENKYEVKIVLGARYQSDINNILRSTMSAGQLSLFTISGDGTESNEESIVRGTATVDYDDKSQAYIKVEVNEEVEKVVTKSKEGDNNSLLVLWQGKYEGLDYTDLKNGKETFTYNGNQKTYDELKDKVLSVINIIGKQNSSDSSDSESTTSSNGNYFKEEVNGQTKYYVTFDSYGYADSAESSTKFNAESAKSFARLFNEDLLDYEITEVYRQTIDASFGNNAKTLMIVSSICAILVISIYLVIVYRMLALSGIIGMGLTTLLDILIFNLFNIQVGPTVILSLIISLASSVIILLNYYKRTQEDAYKGRALGKASNEGFRKTVSTAIDSTVILVALGIVLAVISRESVKSFALFIFISAALNILFVFLMSKGLNNFLLNSSLNDNVKLFGLNENYVEDLDGKTKEVMPKTLGEKIDVTKHSNKTLIATIVSGVIAIASLLVFTFTSTTFNYTSADSYGRIEVRSTNTQLFENLDKVLDVDKDLSAQEKFVYYLENEVKVKVKNAWTITDQKNPLEDDKYYIYFYADLENVLSDEDMANFEKLENYVKVGDNNASFVGDENAQVTAYTVNPGVVRSDFANTLILVAITVGITLVYFIVRYRYSIALANTASLILGSGISIGLISLIRLEVSNQVGIAVLAGAIMTMLLFIPINNRLAQVKNESKTKITTFAQREEIAKTAYKDSLNQYFVVFLGEIIILLCLIPVVSLKLAPMYIACLISLIINALLGLFMVLPLHLFFEKHLTSRKSLEDKQKIAKAKREKIAKTNRNKGAEPEEIIIPGIND